jgi:hypothetical protein
MTKTILCLLSVFLLFSTASAQRNTHFGVEAAVTHDVYDYIDKGSLLKTPALLSGYYGISIRQDLTSTLFLETGLLRKSYAEGIGFNTSSGYSSSEAIRGWLIPLRMGTRINLNKQKLYLVPVVGFSLGINSDYGYGDGGGGGYEMTAKDTVYYSVYSKLSLRRSFPLLQTGLGAEFVLLRTALVSLSANYYTGFKNLIEQDISYTHNSRPNTATGLSKGDMLAFGLAVKYPVSNLFRGIRD